MKESNIGYKAYIQKFHTGHYVVGTKMDGKYAVCNRRRFIHSVDKRAGHIL
jgi:hypothetical protein